ncbi:hypothetical protein BC829DRAFT_391009 [Chytridium lagenaria]|nr:hypothetical protein BC829DRAFT_391009 [Chytridium lagenaria]
MATTTTAVPTATVTRLVTVTANLNLFVFFRTFKNRTSLVPILTFLFIFFQQVGVIMQFLPDVALIGKSDRLNIWGGVGFFMLSAELFVWTLFCRFQIIAPFERYLQNCIKAWLILESTCVFANYMCWGVSIEIRSFEMRIGSAKAYSGLSIVQSLNAALLSGYFMVKFYWPKLRAIKGTKVIWFKLWSSGFFYLTLEVLLHACYTISFQISSNYYVSVTTLATALRYSLFLLFVYQIRHASKMNTVLETGSTVASSQQPSKTGNEPNTVINKAGQSNGPVVVATSAVEDEGKVRGEAAIHKYEDL